MTRTTTDTIIGIAGAVAIVFTMIGVFAYEYNSVPDEDDADALNQIPSQRHSGELEQGGSFAGNFTPSEGVTDMSIRIDWTPTAPADASVFATYEFELTDPDGIAIDTGSRTTGTTINVPIPVAGEYILTITANGSSLGGSYTLTATYDY